jgi:methyl-accepting chemotaxis protein
MSPIEAPATSTWRAPVSTFSTLAPISDLIAEIGAATQQQTQGIGQVGDAVTQLDRVTQQNAALVEESAAAAESLTRQAASLVEAVAQFRLADVAAPGPSP